MSKEFAKAIMKQKYKSGSKPKDKKLYSSVKSEAKKKFKKYPSKYANFWLSREYKKRGGSCE